MMSCGPDDVNALVKTFWVFCADIDAPKPVIGQKQLNQVLQLLGKYFLPYLKSPNSFRFGDVIVVSSAIVEIDLKIPSPRQGIFELLNKVPVDVPAFLDFDILDSKQFYADEVTNRLVQRNISS